MSTLLEIVRGDGAAIRMKCERKDDAGDWAVPDFTGATPRLIIRGTTPQVFTVSIDGTFEDVAEGIAAFLPTPGMFPGSGLARARAEVEVTYPSGGTPETFPKSAAKIPVVIADDLD